MPNRFPDCTFTKTQINTGTYIWQCCLSPGPHLKCGIKVQNGIKKFKLGFPVPKYQRTHLGTHLYPAPRPPHLSTGLSSWLFTGGHTLTHNWSSHCTIDAQAPVTRGPTPGAGAWFHLLQSLQPPALSTQALWPTVPAKPPAPIRSFAPVAGTMDTQS